MNYYIQGNKEKADQIKAAFEKLGYNTGYLGFTSGQLYYTVEGKVELMCIKSLQNLIKTHPDYKELELPVKPKFKVGDWIACDADSFTLSIKSVKDENYYFHQGASLPIKDIDEHYHLWSIADAKDGDVLATDNGWTCIFQAFDGYEFSSYCFMDSQNWFCEFGSEAHTLDSRINGNIHPATKEQRELLFAKMREAGYQWDADKKELRKIKTHYDISNFNPFDKVLTRNYDTDTWAADWFSHYVDDEDGKAFITTCAYRNQCIPFNDDTKHLLGTTDMPDECYINW